MPALCDRPPVRAGERVLTMEKKVLSAVLIDLENLYLALKEEYHNAADLTVEVLQRLREHLSDKLGWNVVIGRAYAPLDYSSVRIFLNDLALMGITPVHSLAKSQRSLANLVLAIDCMELLFRREDIENFVIVGGDRDYIPVAERIRQNARRVLMVSPRHAMSGDLLSIVGADSYIDPVELLPAEKRQPAFWDDVTAQASERSAPDTEERRPQQAEQIPARPVRAFEEVTFTAKWGMPDTMQELQAMVDDEAAMLELRRCTRMLLDFQRRKGGIQEVWLGPFLREMNEGFPLKNNSERKELLTSMSDFGIIEIVQRPRHDDVGTFAVVLVNWQHPLVIAMNPG